MSIFSKARPINVASLQYREGQLTLQQSPDPPPTQDATDTKKGLSEFLSLFGDSFKKLVLKPKPPPQPHSFSCLLAQTHIKLLEKSSIKKSLWVYSLNDNALSLNDRPVDTSFLQQFVTKINHIAEQVAQDRIVITERT